MSNNLDLYAKVEDLIGIKESAPALYEYYYDFLEKFTFDSLLDVGCGSGDFLLSIRERFGPSRLLGIDLSAEMVKRSSEKGLDATCVDLCDLEGSYDVITAIFDMVNYLDPDALQKFLVCIEERLNSGGYFLCDINTIAGFEEVGVGSYTIDDGERFLAIDSDFEDGHYTSHFTLFEQDGTHFTKSRETIHQYYHPAKRLQKGFKKMKLLSRNPINLYIDEGDKEFLVFGKA